MRPRFIIMLFAFCVAQGITAQITPLGLVEESNLSAVDKKGAMYFVPELSFVDDYLYVATPKGLYRYLCDESGSEAEWEKLPLTDKLVLDFEVRGDTLIVLTREQLLFSSDGGKTTQSISIEEVNDSGKWALSGMAIHPYNVQQMYATCGAKLMRTQNGGVTWEEICYDDGSHIQMTRLFYNPHNPNSIIGFYNKGFTPHYGHLLFSHDGGSAWESGKGKYTGNNTSEIHNIAFHPTIEDRVFVCGSSVYGLSEDSGASWTGIFEPEWGQCVVFITDIIYDSHNFDILYGAEMFPNEGATTVVYSTDGGYTWETFFSESIVPKGHVLAMDMKDNLLALYTFSGGIYLLDVDAINTSVSPIVDDGSESAYYDIQGRKITHPTRGIYIKDGRKVVIK